MSAPEDVDGSALDALYAYLGIPVDGDLERGILLAFYSSLDYFATTWPSDYEAVPLPLTEADMQACFETAWPDELIVLNGDAVTTVAVSEPQSR